jgi:hypothetical protein
VIVDGQAAFSGTMHAGGTRTFEGADVIKVSLGSGRSAQLTVNGQPLGRPGKTGHPYTASFGPSDFRRSTTSGNG